MRQRLLAGLIALGLGTLAGQAVAQNKIPDLKKPVSSKTVSPQSSDFLPTVNIPSKNPGRQSFNPTYSVPSNQAFPGGMSWQGTLPDPSQSKSTSIKDSLAATPPGKSSNQPDVTSNPNPSQHSILPNPSQTGPDGDEDHWAKMFQNQADLITQSLGNKLRPLVVKTDDPSVHDFIWKGLLRRPEAVEVSESGLAGLYVGTGLANGQVQPMCYVLYRYDKAGSTQRQFMMPLTQPYGETVAAAFLMGHEVGHCLDFMERSNALRGQPVWSSDDATKIGISDVAYTRVFGTELNDNLYVHRFPTLEADLAQGQYQERVADIMGIFWAWTQGMPQEGVGVIRESRKFQLPTTRHNTEPALEGLESFYKSVMDANGNLETLWQIARQVQTQKGVTPEAVAWVPPVNENHSDQINSAEVDRSGSKNDAGSGIVTLAPQTPVLFGTSKPVGHFGTPPPPVNSATGPRNFDSLPRFGN